MGLLPIVGKALGLFSILIVSALTVSYILYKFRSPKKKPYEMTKMDFQYAQKLYRPAFESVYYSAPEARGIPEVRTFSDLRSVPEAGASAARNAGAGEVNVRERRDLTEKKKSARHQNRFQILHSTEEGEIKAYRLPM